MYHGLYACEAILWTSLFWLLISAALRFTVVMSSVVLDGTLDIMSLRMQRFAHGGLTGSLSLRSIVGVPAVLIMVELCTTVCLKNF